MSLSECPWFLTRSWAELAKLNKKLLCLLGFASSAQLTKTELAKPNLKKLNSKLQRFQRRAKLIFT
ncbi:MAG: hypothetical protein A3F17_05090 [Gammaproteobacteria bacterium RIFCSPHIGHO2_12_FULL_41_15]|nr:MAG: hypothetical protein A3F17_05090 [Gammaproteobacteria bacterium RIFCSPHIGHO2_12_FULL_41_15]